MSVINIPNLISLFRLLVTPAIIWLVILELWTAVFYLFVVAGLSDAVDGFIAKKFNAVTRLGEFLDPIADKALLVSIFLSLGYADKLPIWLVILVVSRDILIIGGALLLYTLQQQITVRPIWSSKANTFAQIFLAACVLAAAAYDWHLGWIMVAMIWLTAATTVISGAGYLLDWSQRLGNLEPPR
jgi:cardiolipin synthase